MKSLLPAIVLTLVPFNGLAPVSALATDGLTMEKLVTSETPGAATRSDPMEIGGRKFQPGTIIGKALEALDGGAAEILVLLSLQ